MAIKIITKDGAITEFSAISLQADGDGTALLQFGKQVADRVSDIARRRGQKITFVLDEIAERFSGLDITLIAVDAHYETAIKTAKAECQDRLEQILEDTIAAFKEGQ